MENTNEFTTNINNSFESITLPEEGAVSFGVGHGLLFDENGNVPSITEAFLKECECNIDQI